MPKRIAFLSDGTWQTPLNNTNVYRLYQALLPQSAGQAVLYDPGIGGGVTGLDRLLEGAFATTIFQKITEGYTQIAHAYNPGDQLYLFGFSRGAYTARSIAGMIAACGLPTGSFTDECVQQAFAAYRTPSQRAQILASLGACNLTPANIVLVGVWDTVGSLGIPAIFGGIDQDKYGFLDTNLHPDVKNAVQCLAIDEHRAQFPDTLWTVPNPPNPGQTIEQVWFTGCHGNVGGGTPVGSPIDDNTRLCDITMGYMLSKAIAFGLVADPTAVAQFGTLPADAAMDGYQDSYKPENGKPFLRTIAPGSTISNSVALRIQYVPEYQPANLTVAENVLDPGYPQLQLVNPIAI